MTLLDHDFVVKYMDLGKTYDKTEEIDGTECSTGACSLDRL